MSELADKVNLYAFSRIATLFEAHFCRRRRSDTCLEMMVHSSNRTRSKILKTRIFRGARTTVEGIIL